MAENVTNGTLEKVWLGDTTKDAVDKINSAIEQVNANADAIEDAGKVDEIRVGGTNVVKDKIVNFVKGPNVSITGDASKGEITISSTDTKNTAGTGPLDTKLWLIGTMPTPGDVLPSANSTQKTYSGKVYMKDGKLYTYNKDDKDDGKKVLDTDDYAALSKLIGDLAGGMRYINTSDAIATTGNGTQGTPYVITDKTYNAGDTYKVVNKGYYKYKSTLLSKPSADGTATNIIGVGDLFIYASGAWTVVPSGDDGDVYADTAWSSPDRIIVTGNETTSNKKVKNSGKTISTSIDASSDKVPTNSAVKTYVDGLIKCVPITGNTADGWTNNISSSSYLGYRWSEAANYKPLAVYDSNGVQLLVAFKYETDGSHGITIGVDSAAANNVIGGTLVLIRT